MAASAHYYPLFEQNQLAAKKANLTTDALNVLLIATGTYTWGATPETQQFVSDVLGGDGTHGALTEVSTVGTGYTRQALTGVTLTNSGENITLDSNNPSWSSATFSCVYLVLYDTTIGSGDSSHPVIAFYDFGGTQTVSGTTFTPVVNTNGLVQWQGS